MGIESEDLERCDGSGSNPKCRTQVPHDHCDCGLPMKVGRLYCELCVDEKELARRFVERERNDGLLAARAYHPPARWAERMKERQYQPAYRKAKALR